MLAKLGCWLISTVLALSLATIATGFLLSPAFAFLEKEKWENVVPISGLPVDGTPIQIRLMETRRDAWMIRSEFVGRAWVRCLPAPNGVLAFETISPHGSAVFFDSGKNCFREWCWGCDWALDGNMGAVQGWGDLISLPVRIREGDVYIDVNRVGKTGPWGNWRQTSRNSEQIRK